MRVAEWDMQIERGRWKLRLVRNTFWTLSIFWPHDFNRLELNIAKRMSHAILWDMQPACPKWDLCGTCMGHALLWDMRGRALLEVEMQPE
jgi:hypothetical protein